MKFQKLKNFITEFKDDSLQPYEKTEVEGNDLKKESINRSLDKTIDIVKSIYSIPSNNDVKIRNIIIGGINKKAALVYISTIVDLQLLEGHIIQPLLSNTEQQKMERIISAGIIQTAQIMEEAVIGMNNGDTAVFIEGEDIAYIVGTSNFQGRSIENAADEVVVKGPKEAFNEKANDNISLIRKRLKNEHLIAETTVISKRSKNNLYIVYVKDLVDKDILSEMKKRVNDINVDAIQNLSILEEYIEDRKGLFPTILYTERPDRATSFLEDGHIVLLMDNSPASLVLPATFCSFFHNAEDHYLRFLFGNFTRLLRLLALFITLFTSAFYISVTNYHMEMLPADLLFAISATREIVPFPSIIEVLIMEIAFELIREAGLRVPNPIGPTIGIVGALILGQAAVQANIVSPLVVIIVALGGLCSFAIGDINLNFAIRLSRFIFIFAAAIFGFYGIAAIFVIGLLHLVSIKSFDVPYFAPMTPKFVSSKDTIFRRMVKNETFRPGYLKTGDIKKKAGE